MHRLIEIAGGVCILLLVLLLSLICLPFVIIWWPINAVSRWHFARKYRAYLRVLENKNFFCYNNRNDALDFIEKQLVPSLDKDVELIYLNGLDPESMYESRYISHALYQLKSYHRFPHLMKVRKGLLIDQSINNECFNIINQNKPMDKLLNDIRKFFST
jgi:hypothetical protein